MYILLISLRPEKQFCKVCTVKFNCSSAAPFNISRILHCIFDGEKYLRGFFGRKWNSWYFRHNDFGTNLTIGTLEGKQVPYLQAYKARFFSEEAVFNARKQKNVWASLHASFITDEWRSRDLTIQIKRVYT